MKHLSTHSLDDVDFGLFDKYVTRFSRKDGHAVSSARNEIEKAARRLIADSNQLGIPNYNNVSIMDVVLNSNGLPKSCLTAGYNAEEFSVIRNTCPNMKLAEDYVQHTPDTYDNGATQRRTNNNYEKKGGFKKHPNSKVETFELGNGFYTSIDTGDTRILRNRALALTRVLIDMLEEFAKDDTERFEESFNQVLRYQDEFTKHRPKIVHDKGIPDQESNIIDVAQQGTTSEANKVSLSTKDEDDEESSSYEETVSYNIDDAETYMESTHTVETYQRSAEDIAEDMALNEELLANMP